MSEPKVVEAVGRGRVDLSRALGAVQSNAITPSITKVRVQKVRDGRVYEDVTLETKPYGFHG